GDYEIAAFFGLVAIFGVCEHFWPARRVDHWRDLRLDVLSFAFALLVNRICTHLIKSWVGDFTPTYLNGVIHFLQGLPSAVKILTAIFIVDFIIYWIHRAQHQYSFLWRTHKWHHSIEQMYWFAGFRTSFLHSLLYNIPQTVIPMQLFHMSPLEAGAAYSLGLFIQFWEHTNVKVNIGWLKNIFITPQYHRVHHSASEHQGMNLGTTFSLCDRMFGTYVDPDALTESFPLGLGEPIERKEVPRMLIGV